jgi:hypothetical protein
MFKFSGLLVGPGLSFSLADVGLSQTRITSDLILQVPNQVINYPVVRQITIDRFQVSLFASAPLSAGDALDINLFVNGGLVAHQGLIGPASGVQLVHVFGPVTILPGQTLDL